MKTRLSLILVTAATVTVACGASFPEPTQRLADAQGARRSAEEVGANNQPASQLYVKLADEEMTKANALIKDGDNRAADRMLVRAKADAELALALAHEQNAKVETQQAIDKATATTTTNAIQGVQK
jgi:5'-3' exonuclease